MKYKILYLFFLLHFTLKAQNCEPVELPGHWGTNARIHALARADSLLYIGGTFRFVGPNTGSSAKIKLDGSPDVKNWPKINGYVFDIIPDENHGWYVGGLFTTVGDSVRKNIAYIDSNGKVSPWTLDLNGLISQIMKLGSKLYLSGGFSTINGISRNKLACFNLTTKTVTAWNPNPNEWVNDMHFYNNRIYIGGKFTNISSTIRRMLVSYDTSGNLTSWNPRIGPKAITVLKIRSIDTLLYISGSFDSIGGKRKENFCEISPITALSTAWFPKMEGMIHEIAKIGDTLYVVGGFDKLDGASRNNIAAYRFSTKTLIPAFIPLVNDQIESMSVADSCLYITGRFTSINYTEAKYIAKLNRKTGQLVSNWESHADDQASRIVIKNGYAYVAGVFSIAGGVSRSSLACINLNTGRATSWNPNTLSGFVMAINPVKPRVFVGGEFSTISGGARRNFADLHYTNATASPWNPSPIGTVNCMVLKDSILYVGGYIGKSDSFNINGIVAYNLNDSTRTSLNLRMSVNSKVNSIVLDNDRMFIGGLFDSVRGKLRNNLACFNLAGDSLEAWNPKVNGEVNALAKSGHRLYAGGTFTTLNFTAIKYLVCLNDTNGNHYGWDPKLNGAVSALKLHDKILYTGGSFTLTDTSKANYLAAFDDSTGKLIPWRIKAQNPVLSISVDYVHQAVGWANELALEPKKHLSILSLKKPKFWDHPIAQTTCIGARLILSVSTEDSVLSYQWYKNDSLISTSRILIKDPVKMSDSGEYYCVITDSCFSSKSHVAKIKVVANPAASFTISDSIQCLGSNEFNFQNTSAGLTTPFSITWDFNDGSFSSDSFPSHHFDSAGIYQVKLKVTNNGTCSDTATRKVTVLRSPVTSITVNNLVQCFRNNEFTLNNLSAVDSSDQIEWKIGDSTFTGHSYIITSLASHGNYPAILKISTDDGCEDSDTLNLIVHPSPEARIFLSDADSCMASNHFAVRDTSVINNGSIRYRLWRFGATDSSHSSQAQINFNSAGEYDIVLIVSSDQLCTDSAKLRVKVYANPVLPQISGPLTDTVKTKATYTLSNPASNLSYYWTVSGGTQLTGNPASSVQVLWDSVNTGTVTVIAYDSNGCYSDTAEISVSLNSLGVGLEDLTQSKYMVFPNPAGRYLNVHSAEPSEIRIFDHVGRLVRYETMKAGILRITIDELSEGTYFLVISTAYDVPFRTKIIINHSVD